MRIKRRGSTSILVNSSPLTPSIDLPYLSIHLSIPYPPETPRDKEKLLRRCVKERRASRPSSRSADNPDEREGKLNGDALGNGIGSLNYRGREWE